MNKSVVGKVLAILIFLGCIALWVFYPRHMPPPDEANRITHPDGYSFIKPAGWETDFMTAEATVNPDNRGWLRADPPNKGHDPSALVVNVLTNAPNPSKQKNFSPTTFHDLPAMVNSEKYKNAWVYRIQFKDHGWWFEINLSLPYKIDGSDPDWGPYLDSFRFEPDKASAKAAARTASPVFVFPTTSFATTQPSSK